MSTAAVPRRECAAEATTPTIRLVLRRTSIAILACLVLAAPATAGTIVVGLSLVPGRVAVKAPVAHLSPGRTVDLPLQVADGRGTGHGWVLNLRGSGLRVTRITAACAAGSTCTLPAPAGAPGGDSILRAARGTGMGVIDLVVTVQATARTTARFAVAGL